MTNQKLKKITRGISKEFADAFIESNLFKLYQKKKEELFLGVRNEYLNIYYNAASVCKVRYNNTKGNFFCTTARKYLYGYGNGYRTIPADDLCVKYDKIIHVIREKYSKLEKKAQHQLVCKNNKNKNSKWLCIDIEYAKQRNDKSEAAYGRFDIIAIGKVKPYKIALIELKYNSSAMGGKSGIVKHVCDHIRFVKNHVYENHLKREIVDIVNSQNSLKNCNLCIKDVCELAEKPEFYFITLDNKNDNPRKTMYRYLRNNVEGASICNVEKVCGIDITGYNAMNFSPIFLFSDNIVDDIIESGLYTRGFEGLSCPARTPVD